MKGFFAAFGGQLLEWVLPTLATAIAGLAMAILKKQLAKLGIELDEKQETRIRQIVHDAIVRTEEVARREPMTSAEKAVYTERTILEQAPELDPATARHMVDVMLPIVRSRGISSEAGKKPAPVPSTPATFGRPSH